MKDVRPDEQNKIGTRGSHNNEWNFVFTANDFIEPSTYKEAVKHKEWQQAMVEEYQVVIDNNTWKLVDFPSSVKPLANLGHFAMTILTLLRRYVVDIATNLESLKCRFMEHGNFDELELTPQARR